MSSELHTPLYPLHQQLGAKMTAFAGYSMPVQYPPGVLQEHLHCRDQAGLFDVSHMGQILVHGENQAAQLEAVLPADLQGMASGQMRYSLLLNAQGGILDDLMVTRIDQQQFMLVVNAACKQQDLAYLQQHLPELQFTLLPQQALLALQGPQARAVLSALLPETAELPFMHGLALQWQGQPLYVSCSGYTGEDGFELSVPAALAVTLAEQLLSDARVAPIGLGARDSLRLEAGLCLYGQDMDAETTVVEAALQWAVPAVRRRDGARAGGFVGAETTLQQIAEGAARKRVGLAISGRAPLRGGVELSNAKGELVGRVTSGGFSPSLAKPVAMAMVDSACAALGSELLATVRGKQIAVQVCKPAFVAARYYRG